MAQILVCPLVQLMKYSTLLMDVLMIGHTRLTYTSSRLTGLGDF